MSKWSNSKKYHPKKKHDSERRTYYSVPGVDEVVFSDEWQKKKKSSWWKFWR